MTSTDMTMYGGGSGASWRVVNVTQGVGQDPTGRYVNGFEVTYQLKSGLSGTVFLAKDAFNEDAVAAAVSSAAATLYNVSQLSQG